MNKVHIHYRPSDGEIVGFENTIEPSCLPGYETVTLTVEDGTHIVPDSKLHKIDVATHELVDKTPEEQAIALLPTQISVRNAIATELRATDEFMVPDRPMSDATRSAWTTYRQALRDLSKQGFDACQMLKEWPKKPGGASRVPLILDPEKE